MILGILFGALVLGVTAAFVVILGKHKRAINARVAAFRQRLDECRDIARTAETEHR